jgi:hypothetical protein
MPRPAPPRLHRLPRWTDQILIPATSDISITEVAGKSPLPTIIVTPCSPSSTHDYSLAFIPSPPKQGIRERLQSYKTPYASSWRVRLILCAFLLLSIICQLLSHRLAARYPRLEFTSVEATEDPIPPQQSLLDWFNSWSDAGRYDRVVEQQHVPEVVPFDHEVGGGWLD